MKDRERRTSKGGSSKEVVIKTHQGANRDTTLVARRTGDARFGRAIYEVDEVGVVAEGNADAPEAAFFEPVVKGKFRDVERAIRAAQIKLYEREFNSEDHE